MINGELIVDNFAGGGGASTGIELATGYSVDIAINHDPEAIRMHQTNHPNTKHYCEDVWMVDPVKVCNGRPVGLAWFSPDCKHFSKAKGGKPKDKNIRGLAWVACRWAGLVRPRVIMLENVEEFKGWGPLNRQHHPIKAKRGTTFQKFVHQLNDLGYEVQYRELIAADYGAPTTRKRFFLIARCDGKPIVWPSPTHAPADSPEVKNGHLKPYLGAYTQIDFQRPCPSIFDTAEEIKEKYGIRAQRPLSPKTMERIARGIQKYILENPEPFLVQCNHGGDRKAGDLHIPLPTITAKNGYGIVRPTLAPCKSGKISAFLHKYYSGGYKGAGECMKNPLPTVTAWDHNSIVAATLVQMNNHCDGKDIRNPLPTITAGDGHFGEVRAFLLKFYGNRSEGDLKEPLNVITTKDKFGLVTISGTDYQIVDIGLRMLEPQELYGCQGFPSDYIIDHDYTGKTYQRAEQVKILRLNRKHLSQMTYYFTSFQDNSCSHDGQSSICRIHSMQYIPVTPNMRDYNLLDSLGVAPDLERILDYAMLYGATYVELTGNDADIDPLLPTFKWTLDNDILYAILKDGEQMATYFAIGIDFPCHCIVPANFVLGSSDFSACIEDTLRRIASLYPESTTAELYANMGAVPDEKIPEGEEDNWVPVDLGYSIPEILRIENSPKPPLYFKVNPHYEDTLAFKMPYFDMDYLEKHVRPEFDEISEIIPISPEDYQKSIKYEDVCTSARN